MRTITVKELIRILVHLDPEAQALPVYALGPNRRGAPLQLIQVHSDMVQLCGYAPKLRPLETDTKGKE